MAGKGKADGGLSGSVRNPEFFCSRTGCEKYRIKGSPLCQSHGAQRKAAAKRAIAGELAKDTGAVVKPADVPRIVTEIAAWHAGFLLDLQEELDNLSLIYGPVERAREYADVFSQMNASAAALAKLVTSFAALDIADSFRTKVTQMTDVERANRVNALIASTARTAREAHCPTCSCHAVDAEVVEG